MRLPTNRSKLPQKRTAALEEDVECGGFRCCPRADFAVGQYGIRKSASVFGSDGFQDLFGVDFRTNLAGGEDALHASLFVDEEGGAQEADGDAAVAIFLTPHAHGFDESLVGVGNEGEGQGLGGGKLLMALGRIGAYAQDVVAQGL